LIAVGNGCASDLQLPSIDLEIRISRVGSDGGGLPGDVTIICVCVVSEPVEGAGICRIFGIRGQKSKAILNVWCSRLTAENPTDDAHVGVICTPTISQAKQARGLAGVGRRLVIGHEDWGEIAVVKSCHDL